MSSTYPDHFSGNGPVSNPNGSHQSSDIRDRIDLVVIDDHPVVCNAIRSAAEDSMDMKVVGEARSTEEASQLVAEKEPDVAIVDLSLRDGFAFDLLDTFSAPSCKTASLVFSMYDENVYAQRAFRAGASGYLMKVASAGEVLKAARRVHEGGVYLSEKMTRRVLKKMVEEKASKARFPINELTDRELQVFRMLGQGLTLSEIADRLGLARKTVETHQRRAREKFGYETAAEVLSHAARWSLGQPEERT